MYNIYMDTQLEKALELSKSLETISNQKTQALTRYQQNKIFYYNGGTFVADTSLLAASAILKSEDTQIFVDINNIPIEVTDMDEFCFKVYSTYTSASRQYLKEFNEIKRVRTPKGILEK
jgi:UDP-3-O-[3-hydroxymyristoyl] glucosamine N-acyltransferase